MDDKTVNEPLCVSVIWAVLRIDKEKQQVYIENLILIVSNIFGMIIKRPDGGSAWNRIH